MTRCGLAAHFTLGEAHNRTLRSDTSEMVAGAPNSVGLLTEGYEMRHWSEGAF